MHPFPRFSGRTASQLLRLLWFVAVSTITTFSAPARAWYVAEHVIITQDALDMLPISTRQALQVAWSDTLGSTPGVDAELCRDFLAVGTDPEESVQFSALPALAADHSNSIEDLHTILTSGKALRILKVGRSHWKKFLELERVQPSRTAISVDITKRAMIVDNINAALALVDDNYLSLAVDNYSHFATADESLAWTLQALVEQGRIDNALAQFVVHHLRSLELAADGRDDAKEKLSAAELKRKRRDAFLEHAFAVHFLQDAYSSGHAIISTRDRTDAQLRSRRHNYFDRVGLHMQWALSRWSCATPRIHACAPLAPEADSPICRDELALSPCWTGYGDGYLASGGDNRAPDKAAPDRKHVAFATAKTQMLFALALKDMDACRPGRSDFDEDETCSTDSTETGSGTRRQREVAKSLCDEARNSIGESEIPYAVLLDAAPPFSTASGGESAQAGGSASHPSTDPVVTPTNIREGTQLAAKESHATRIVQSARKAIIGLRDCTHRTNPIDANNKLNAPTAHVVTAKVVGQPFSRVEPADIYKKRASQPRQKTDPCDLDRVALGMYLLRPVLVVWPIAAAPPAELPGQDANRWGFAMQLWAGTNASMFWEYPYGKVNLGVVAAGGFSYRAERFLAGRPNIAGLELNAGLVGTVAVPFKRDPYDQFYWMAEARTEVFSALLWAGFAGLTGKVPDIQGELNPLPMGVRFLWGTDSAGKFDLRAVDFEGPSIVMPWAFAPPAASAISPLPWLLRLRGGWFYPDENVPIYQPYIGLELAGGVSVPIPWNR
ncbi:MAG: hypothetical protein IPK82_16450 [Polyangiaceae bacterium]|nr:hypothetical protein [Polyangiaceae bacterium]